MKTSTKKDLLFSNQHLHYLWKKFFPLILSFGTFLSFSLLVLYVCRSFYFFEFLALEFCPQLTWRENQTTQCVISGVKEMDEKICHGEELLFEGRRKKKREKEKERTKKQIIMMMILTLFPSLFFFPFLTSSSFFHFIICIPVAISCFLETCDSLLTENYVSSYRKLCSCTTKIIITKGRDIQQRSEWGRRRRERRRRRRVDCFEIKISSSEELLLTLVSSFSFSLSLTLLLSLPFCLALSSPFFSISLSQVGIFFEEKNRTKNLLVMTISYVESSTRH